ncbi:sensor domain-containing diguanylate cyclase [Actinoplanes sp. NEAU-A12]|uniref:Sensor domain-containing diguanylate cyclase n=1 Tax=Actinoplanes sandaracinus TaxID=3045177 RepID=A0ABT6WN03_9ACTN|nr:sensor domain-containing diguanylate cyclase [Actinoplanes sandaracinus]MDI6101109.1 sensor domain-containing diguanylate cyclase [Actinoplanes sandaracinus]
MSTAVRAPLWRDPVLVALTVAAVLVLGAFLLDVGTPRAQLVACWSIAPVLDLLQFWLSRRAWRTLTLPPYARRFWQAVSAAGLLFFAGDTAQLVTVLADPALDRLIFHPAQSAGVMIGVLVCCVAALLPRSPANWSRRERIRLLLDTAIVGTASAVVAWCLMTRPGMAGAGAGAYVVALFSCGLMLCAVYVALRSGLGVAPLSGTAAVPVVASTLMLAAANILLPSGSAGDSGTQLAMVIAPCFVLLAAPRIQILDGPRGLDGRRWWSARRGHHVLPYGGTVVCAATLVIVLATQGLGLSAWGALAGLLVNVGMVIGRQLLALAENNDLLVGIRNREQRLSSLLKHSSEIISIATRDGVFTYVSPAVEPVLGFPVETVLGYCALDILHHDDRARLAGDLAVLYSTPGAELTYQGRYRHADGSWRWLEVVGVNLTHEPGIDGVVCNSRDVTESRELHERLRYQAGHDELTGLANRRQFTAAISARAGDATVLLIDLNGFKQINDTYGHATGDAVLRHVAGLLRDCAGPDDVPARLGGDEFAVLAGGDRAEAERIAARLRDALAVPADLAGRRLRVGASIGLATDSTADPDHLLNAADLRMYEEKQHSRAYVS